MKNGREGTVQCENDTNFQAEQEDAEEVLQCQTGRVEWDITGHPGGAQQKGL